MMSHPELAVPDGEKAQGNVEIESYLNGEALGFRIREGIQQGGGGGNEDEHPKV